MASGENWRIDFSLLGPKEKAKLKDCLASELSSWEAQARVLDKGAAPTTILGWVDLGLTGC